MTDSITCSCTFWRWIPEEDRDPDGTLWQERGWFHGDISGDDHTGRYCETCGDKLLPNGGVERRSELCKRPLTCAGCKHRLCDGIARDACELFDVSIGSAVVWRPAPCKECGGAYYEPEGAR